MRTRNRNLAIILPCTAVGAVWSALAFHAIETWFSRNWGTNAPATPWTDIAGLIAPTFFLFIPGDLLVHQFIANDSASSVIGGAIEGALVGGVVSLIVAAVAKRRKATGVAT